MRKNAIPLLPVCFQESTKVRSSGKSSLNHSPLARICSAVLLMICATLSMHGQTVSGRISGTIRDKNGAVIPNATVTVTNTATNLVRTATADESGFYTLTNLPVGTYTVMGELKGFKKALQNDNVLTADARLTVDITLEPGELDRKSTRLNSSHGYISYAVFCLKKKKTKIAATPHRT